jgi:4-hydroxyacetophenone monooxygenase
MRNPHAGEPFDASDDAIAEALLDVSIPTLMLSLVHITGDPELIRGPLRPAGLFLNEVQGFMSEEDKATVRALAVGIITDWRDRGCPEVEPLGGDLVHEMMNWLTGEEVPEEYLPLVLEEMGLDGRDAGQVEPLGTPEARREFPVVVIGCGESGLLAGIRLKEAGLPFTIVEKNAGVGGTWFENSYPGARVDVGNHFYCYTFEPSDHWSEYFARQPELQRYFTTVMERHGVTDHVRFSTEVLGATWDEGEHRWQVRVRTADGTEETLVARAVISAVGQLNRPFIPDLPGLDTFAGPAFHSARWDHSVDLAGRRVAMIGAGATGFQIAPTIAPVVGNLTIFQRTAQWMFPNPNYHLAVGEGMRWAMRHLPFYGRWYRFLLFWPGCDKGLEPARVDPDYPDQQRAVSEVNEFTRQMFSQWIIDQVGDDPDLLAKVLPDYPATGKRTLQDNGAWLGCLKRENVELVRTPIARVEADAVVTTDGIRHPADVLVLATGFRATEMLAPMAVIGRNGVDLTDWWGERPAAHLGITVPGFPNFFLMYGPGTNLAHGGSLIFHSECQIRYIMGCLALLVEDDPGGTPSGGQRAVAPGPARTMEPRADVYDAWHERTQAEIRTLVWSQPSIRHSFFKNSHGEIHGLSPWRLVDYWNWTRQPDPAEFVFD